MFKYKFDDPVDFKLRADEEPLFLRYLAKKFVAQGDSLKDISLSFSDDLDFMVKVFIVYPPIEDKFYTYVKELSETEADKIQPQAVAGAMRQLNDILTGKTQGVETKDIISCAKAMLVYAGSGRKKDGPIDPLEEILKSAQETARKRQNGE